MKKLIAEFKNLNLEPNEILHKLYFTAGESSSFSSIDRLYLSAKRYIPQIKRKQVAEWLKKQETYGAFHAQKHHHARRHYMVKEPNTQCEFDIAVFLKWANYQFPKKYAYLMIFIDCFSKKLWTRPLMNRSGTEVAQSIAQILDEMPRYPKSIRSDREASFMSYHMAAVCKSREVRQSFTLFLPKVRWQNSIYCNMYLKAAMAERVISTIKGRLARAMHHSNKISGARKWQWSKLIPDVVTAYNNAYNRSVGMSPNDASKIQNLRAVLKHREKYFHSFKYAKEIDFHSKFTFEIADKVYKQKIR